MKLTDTSNYSSVIRFQKDLLYRMIQDLSAPANRYETVSSDAICSAKGDECKTKCEEISKTRTQLLQDRKELEIYLSAPLTLEEKDSIKLNPHNKDLIILNHQLHCKQLEISIKNNEKKLKDLIDSKCKNCPQKKILEIGEKRHRTNHKKFGQWNESSKGGTKAASMSSVKVFLALGLVCGSAGCAEALDIRILSKLCGFSDRSVHRALDDLYEHGFIHFSRVKIFGTGNRRTYDIVLLQDFSLKAQDGGAGFIRLTSDMVLHLLKAPSVGVLRASIATLLGVDEDVYLHGNIFTDLYNNRSIYKCNTSALRQIKIPLGQSLTNILNSLSSFMAGKITFRTNPRLIGKNDGRFDQIEVQIDTRLVPRQQSGFFSSHLKDYDIENAANAAFKIITGRASYQISQGYDPSRFDQKQKDTANLLGLPISFTSNEEDTDNLDYTLYDSLITAGRAVGSTYIKDAILDIYIHQQDMIREAYFTQHEKNPEEKKKAASIIGKLGSYITTVAQEQKKKKFCNILNFQIA